MRLKDSLILMMKMSKVFLIKEGKHYSRHFPSLTLKRNIKFSFTMCGDLSYSLPNGNQDDINKLYGVSDGMHHHKHSVRLGWRWVEGKGIELLGYCYSNGRRDFKSICFIEPDKKYEAIIQIHKEKYIIFVNDKVSIFTRTSKWCLMRYRLFPYFGGDEVATKNFKIIIDEHN